MTDRPEEELAPCPCCGGTLELHENDWCEPPMWSAWCKCGLTFPERPAKADAIWAANRRAPSLTEAEERGRRKGLAEAAQSLDSHAAYCDEQMKVSGDKHGLWALCRDEALRRARVIRALAAAPREDGE